MNLQKLYDAAKSAQSRAYAPYSKFKVGAAILDDAGEIHVGCNVENSAYPIGCCAEQSAVSQMIVNGGKKIEHILVYGKANEACPPCGSCRQIIFEHGHKSTMIHMVTQNHQFISKKITEMLPDAFDHLQLEK